MFSRFGGSFSNGCRMTINYNAVDPKDLEFVVVAEKSEIGNGEKLFLEIDEFQIILFNIAGKFFAIGDLCSHDGAPLGEGELEDEEIVCARHGAHFSVQDGKALSLPAIEDIPAYPVRLDGDDVLIGIPSIQ